MYLVKEEENINKINNSQLGRKNDISTINKIDVMQNKSKYTITKVCKVRWKMLKETLQLPNILFLFIYAFLKHYIVKLTFNKKHYYIYMNQKNDKVLEKCDQFIKTSLFRWYAIIFVWKCNVVMQDIQTLIKSHFSIKFRNF